MPPAASSQNNCPLCLLNCEVLSCVACTDSDSMSPTAKFCPLAKVHRRSAMRLHIASEEFTVDIAEPSVVGDVLGRLDFDRRRELISTECPPECRLEVVCDLSLEAWSRLMPEGSTRQERRRFAATVLAQVVRDIDRQGGILSLVMADAEVSGVSLDQLVNPVKGHAAERLYECSVCGQRVAGGSVVASKPVKLPTLGVPVVMLAFYCDGCTHVEVRQELANGAGRPTGILVGEPEFWKGEKCSDFCRKFPEQTGVRVA